MGEYGGVWGNPPTRRHFRPLNKVCIPLKDVEIYLLLLPRRHDKRLRSLALPSPVHTRDPDRDSQMRKNKNTTYQKRIANHPIWISRTALDIAAQAQIEDAAEALRATAGELAEVHVVRVDGPRGAAEGQADADGGGACCAIWLAMVMMMMSPSEKGVGENETRMLLTEREEPSHSFDWL